MNRVDVAFVVDAVPQESKGLTKERDANAIK